MSAIPISAAMLVADQYGFTTPFAESPGWRARYGDVEVSQFNSAEMIAEKWDISREQMEEIAHASHKRAKAAIAAGRFENRSDEHTSELQSLMRISYAVFFLKKKTTNTYDTTQT